MDLFVILLFLHVLGAIVAFGPGFVSLVVGPMVAKEPQHANFFARSQALAARAVITPVSISMAITGVGMILVRGWTNLVGTKHWLEMGILLYVIAVVLSMAVMAPASRNAGCAHVAAPGTRPAAVPGAAGHGAPDPPHRDHALGAGRGDHVPDGDAAVLG